jgi:uncharacterized membrane protein
MDRFFPTNDVIAERGQHAASPYPGRRHDIWVFSGSHLRSPRPWHPRLIGAGATLLIAVAVTDLAYSRSLLVQWENFSIWLLVGGLFLALFAGLALALDLALHRVQHIDWLRFSAFAIAALLSVLNALVHSRDAYTAVVPQGLELSLIVAVILVILGTRGWSVGARVHLTNSQEIH